MRVQVLATLLSFGLTFGMTVALQAQGGLAAPSATEPSADGAQPGRLGRARPFVTLNGFVANRGQWPAEVKFFASQGGIDATLLDHALVLRPQPDPDTGAWPPPVVLRFPHAQVLEGQGALGTAHHFILAEGSASNVPSFERVVLRDVLPGIDLVVRIDGRWFAYDVHVAPGADLTSLVIEVEGADSQQLEGADRLVLGTTAGRLEQRIGAAWETDGSGATIPVESRFRPVDAGADRLSFGFEAPGRDPERAFVLDPSLVWSTFVGGTSQELVEDIEVTPDGSVYLAVQSSSTGPTTPGAFQTIKPGGSNAWVGKLSPDGSALEWGTFLGGSLTEQVVGIDVDLDLTIVVVGSSFSSDFPTTPGSLQPDFGGANSDIYVSRLTPDGSALIWSTYYGGADWELADSSALFPSGDVLIAGHPKPNSGDPLPATPGAYDEEFDTGDSILARISADGTQLVFQTYFTSAIRDLVCRDELGIILGGSADASLPTTPGAFQIALAGGDTGSAFVARLDASGSVLQWATFIGGDKSDHVYGLAVDSAGAVYVAGATTSGNFPVTPGTVDSTASSDADGGFVAKLLPGGTGLVWSTYLSACCGGTTLQWDIAVDSAGNAISVGSSNEPDFPTTPDAFQPTYIGGFPISDAHLTKFDAFGETLIYSTYFGGSSTDNLPLVALDAAQDPVMALRSSSSAIPVTPGAYDTSFAGSTDTVVAKFDLDLLPWLVLGGGLAGAVDTPNLAGSGALTPGTPARLSVRGAAVLAPASIVAGAGAANLAFKGGTLVPFPTIILTLTTDSQGSLDLPFIWADVPAGIHIWVQVWVKDVGAQTGYAATNALRLTSQ